MNITGTSQTANNSDSVDQLESPGSQDDGSSKIRGAAVNRQLDTPANTTIDRTRVFHEVAIVGFAILLYFLARGLIHDQQARAFANAESIVDFEQRRGVFVEIRWQEWAVRNPAITTIINWIYIWGHWPVIIGTLIWLMFRHPEDFTLFRNAMLISGAIGLVIFVIFSVAPPRLLPQWDFIDTVTQESHSYRVLQPPMFTNQYAAMPSLHVGWNLLMGIAVATRASRLSIRIAASFFLVMMALSVILTANHYIMDVIIGSIIGLVALGTAVIISEKSWQRRTDRELLN